METFLHETVVPKRMQQSNKHFISEAPGSLYLEMQVRMEGLSHYLSKSASILKSWQPGSGNIPKQSRHLAARKANAA